MLCVKEQNRFGAFLRACRLLRFIEVSEVWIEHEIDVISALAKGFIEVCVQKRSCQPVFILFQGCLELLVFGNICFVHLEHVHIFTIQKLISCVRILPCNIALAVVLQNQALLTVKVYERRLVIAMEFTRLKLDHLRQFFRFDSDQSILGLVLNES